MRWAFWTIGFVAGFLLGFALFWPPPRPVNPPMITGPCPYGATCIEYGDVLRFSGQPQHLSPACQTPIARAFIRRLREYGVNVIDGSDRLDRVAYAHQPAAVIKCLDTLTVSDFEVSP